MVKLKGKTAGQTGQEQFISKGKTVLILQGKLDKISGDNILGVMVLVNYAVMSQWHWECAEHFIFSSNS